jgi:hypothetical protein
MQTREDSRFALRIAEPLSERLLTPCCAAYYGPSGPVIPLEVGRSFRCDVGREWFVMWPHFLFHRNRGPRSVITAHMEWNDGAFAT